MEPHSRTGQLRYFQLCSQQSAVILLSSYCFDSLLCVLTTWTLRLSAAKYYTKLPAVRQGARHALVENEAVNLPCTLRAAAEYKDSWGSLWPTQLCWISTPYWLIMLSDHTVSFDCWGVSLSKQLLSRGSWCASMILYEKNSGQKTFVFCRTSSCLWRGFNDPWNMNQQWLIRRNIIFWKSTTINQEWNILMTICHASLPQHQWLDKIQ